VDDDEGSTTGSVRERVRRVRVRRVLALLCALVLVPLVAAPAAGAATSTPTSTVTTSPDVLEQAQRVPVGAEPDGRAVSLDVSVFTERGATGRRPAVVLAHGFGGSKDDLAAWAQTLARRGYVALTFTARGFGASGGDIHLDAPAYEIADGSKLIDLLAARPDVQLDAPGDPRVGVAGGSYGGAFALMLAADDRRVDADVPAITWNDLAQALFPQSAQAGGLPATAAGTAPAADPGVLKSRWASLFFASGATPAPGQGPTGCGRFAPGACAAYTAAATTGVANPQVLELLRASSPAPLLGRLRAPTLLVQGEQDSLFGLDQADASARAIAATGTPVAVRWIDGGHDGTGADAARLGGLQDDALAWFDHYLLGRKASDAASLDFRYDVPPTSALARDVVQTLHTPAYPGLAGSTSSRRDLPLTGAAQTLVSPPGGAPAAVTGLPGTGPLLGAASGLGGLRALGVLPGQSALFDAPVQTSPLTVVGSSRVRLSVTSSARDATLFVGLWDVAADRTGTLPQQLVAPVRLVGLTPGTPREVDVALPGVVRTVRAGHHLQLVVSSTDQAYAVPRDARTYQVSLVGAQLSVPTADGTVVAGGAPLVPPGLALGVGLLALASLALALWRRRSRRRLHADPALTGVPLVVDGLVKTYRDGQRAVDGVSWRAEQGQVVGLLGPNGAGKTTTLRMVVGLIHPDEGQVHVLGEPVLPGAAVLGEIGVLIEGPGFLPHLSGRANLLAYWAATGRPLDEAHLDEALAVADLGSAIERRVRGYSQGMRQRLGIAQAMLGLPNVLVLDEPTNGLDPPQILALRGVLRDYAATGRTVVVSSHLLSEVEQTCSHVVVMHRGRVVTTGSVADLVVGGDLVVRLVGPDGEAAAPEQVSAAAASVVGLAHVTGAVPGEDGTLTVTGPLDRPDVVRHLVQAGFDVDTVGGRRHLEEVFMSLVAETGAS
jgi:ABC-2 type transport system ATP-binding protein